MSLRPIRGFRFDGAALGGAPVVGPEAGLVLTPRAASPWSKTRTPCARRSWCCSPPSRASG